MGTWPFSSFNKSEVFSKGEVRFLRIEQDLTSAFLAFTWPFLKCHLLKMELLFLMPVLAAVGLLGP